MFLVNKKFLVLREKERGRFSLPPLEPWGKLPVPEFHRGYAVISCTNHAKVPPSLQKK